MTSEIIFSEGELNAKSNLQNMQIPKLPDALSDVEKACLDALRDIQKRLKVGGGEE